MTEFLPRLLVLLALLVAGDWSSARLRLPPPVVFTVLGFVAALLPGIPSIELHPDLILVAFLPPLLYADAFQTSWVDFRRWLRPILMLAIGLVVATIATVGWVTHALLPELPWAVCLLLGAIVSPTDTVAVQAVIERLHVPRRITAVLGGESLVNDATGLVGVQIATVVVLSGAFELSECITSFLRVAGLGVLVGLALGMVVVRANRALREAHVAFALSLFSPYLAYWIAAQLGASGVVAVVVAGFVVAWRVHDFDGSTRFSLFSWWEALTRLLNGLCFALIGLTAPLLADVDSRWLVAGLAVSAVTVLTRAAWCFPGAYIPLALSAKLRVSEGGYPAPQAVAVVSWAGVRGAVSLAAALAIPLEVAPGVPFPGRDAVIALTMVVVLSTLIVQGLTLQPMIAGLGIRGDEDSELEVRRAREATLEAGIARLDEYCSATSCPLSVHHFREQMSDELRSFRDHDDELRRAAQARLEVSQDVRREVAVAQRRALLALRDDGCINDKTYVKLLLELDRSHLGGAETVVAAK